MTNEQVIIEALNKAATMASQGKLHEILLVAARSQMNDSGALYDLWCDSAGNCGHGDQMCSEEAKLECIRRFLKREHEKS